MDKKLENFVENGEVEYKEKTDFFFFDFAHPWISLFANWIANR